MTAIADAVKRLKFADGVLEVRDYADTHELDEAELIAAWKVAYPPLTAAQIQHFEDQFGAPIHIDTPDHSNCTAERCEHPTTPPELSAVDQRTQDRVQRWMLDWHDGREALEIPPPEPLVADWLTLDSTAVLFGRFGTFKTFIALDLALCVAAGIPWQGHETTHVPVLYVLTEGRGAIGRRLAAWEQHYGIEIPKTFHTLTAPVNLLDDGVAEDFAWMVRYMSGHINPLFIVFDTLSRVGSGSDQNDNAVMQATVDVADYLNVAMTPDMEGDDRRACTLFIAHTGWADSTHVRGGSAFESAVSTSLRVERDKDLATVTITAAKQRDLRDDLDPIRLTPLEVGHALVMVPDHRVFGDSKKLTGTQVKKLRVLCDGGAMTIGEWASACGVAANSFITSARIICDLGYAVSLSGAYTVTNAGRGLLNVPLEDQS